MKKRITQKEFAESVGIKKGHLSHLLSGRRNASKNMAIALASKVGCKPEIWIFGTCDQRQVAFKKYQDRTK